MTVMTHILSLIPPRAVAWLLKRRYKIHLRVGHISSPYFILRDVIVTKNGFTIEIEEITVRSSLFSSDVTKLLAVMMHNVRINKDVPVCPSDVDQKDLKSLSPLYFRDKKVPVIIITFVQFMAVQIENVNILALGDGWLANGSAESLTLDGSIVHGAKTLLVSADVAGDAMKLLRHASDACLSQMSFAGNVEATIQAQGELTVEKLNVGVTQCEGSGGLGLGQ